MVALSPRTTVRQHTLEDVVLRVRGITKSFGRLGQSVQVLHGVELDVYAGQLMLIMGPSGSGKTTLLSIAGLLLKPTTGTVEIEGFDVTDCTEAELPSIRRDHVGFIFQGFNLLSALSAAENVRVGLELQGIRGAEAVRQSLALLDRVGLSHRAGHRPVEMSGGEQQRVGIARALASPARLVLADEPTGNLDGETSRRVVDLLRTLAHEEGRAVVVVTHDPRLEPLADRIVRMEDGLITADTNEVR
jgi:putative ABC transport system ATP-binding protein